jgi:hypothetical protein
MSSEDDAIQRIMDGSAWDDFCDQLKSLGRLVQRPETPTDPLNRALGYRYLTQLVRAGLESSVDYADPQYPAFFRLADETKKMLNDNPDNYYQNCVVDPRFDYRIRGTRGTTRFFSFGSKGSSADAGAMVSTGDLDSAQMTFDDGGSFEILMSCEKKPGNWLPMTSDTRFIVVRQTFGDRSKEQVAELSIECLNPDRPNNNLDPTSLEPALQRVIGFVTSTVEMNIDWMERYRKHLNALPEDDQEACQTAGGDPMVHYYQSFWKLAPDEALLVRLTDIPECHTWNLQLSNYWMQSLDYRFFQTWINKFTAKYQPDGSVEIVIAHQDPGPKYPNWLNTLGHDQGGMNGRYVGAESPPKELWARVVKFSDLAGR